MFLLGDNILCKILLLKDPFCLRLNCQDSFSCFTANLNVLSDEEYYSKRFLDCCGLVRQVMLDLRKELGFRIGPWNQAYMYDTLPITIEREEDMKPGDLVFISGIYPNPKCKHLPQS